MRQTASPTSNRYLLLVKFVTGAVFALLLFSNGKDAAYPFMHFTMFLRSRAPLDEQAQRLEILVVDAQGQRHRLLIADFKIAPTDRDPGDTERLIRRAFDPELSLRNQDRYRAYLVNRIQAALPAVAPVQIEVWQSSYRLDWDDPFGQLDPERPDTRQLLGSFPVAPYLQPDFPPDADPDTITSLPVTYPDGAPYGSLAYLMTVTIDEPAPAN